jgi:hypothetical protein
MGNTLDDEVIVVTQCAGPRLECTLWAAKWAL